MGNDELRIAFIRVHLCDLWAEKKSPQITQMDTDKMA